MIQAAELSTRDPKTYAVIGAAMEVHRELGHGFSEHVYQDAFAKVLLLRRIQYESEKPVVIYYKGEPLDCTYKLDFLCLGDVVIELKALDRITNTERAQVINYLKATGLKVALLINFGAQSLQYERIVWNV